MSRLAFANPDPSLVTSLFLLPPKKMGLGTEKSTVAVFVDLTFAYDTVNHGQFLKKVLDISDDLVPSHKSLVGLLPSQSL